MRHNLLAAAALSLLVFNPFNARAEGNDGVAAVVNGEEITVKEMREGYNDNPEIILFLRGKLFCCGPVPKANSEINKPASLI